MTENHNENQINTVYTEAKLMMDQIKAEPASDMDIENFIKLESKKYKKTDDLQDLISENGTIVEKQQYK